MERIKVNPKKNEVILTFNEKIYRWGAVQQAIEDFKTLCEIKIEKKAIILKPKQKENLEKLGYEFYNYTLGVMKNNY